MARTRVTSTLIKDEGVEKQDINTTTPGKASITKILAGTGIVIDSSTGVDVGTGDVTLSVPIAPGFSLADFKDSVRSATTTPVANLANFPVANDDITLVEDDRVLIKDGASIDGVEPVSGNRNGIYDVGVVAGGFAPLTRSLDADSDSEVTAGLLVYVSEGTANADKNFQLITIDPIVLDTTVLVFSPFAVSMGATDHSQLSGLGADDHLQYHTDARGDLRYFREDEHIDVSAGAGDAGKPIKLDVGGKVSSTMVDVITIADGGTGQSTKTDAFDALSPTTTKGDISIRDTNDNIRLPVGADGQVLVTDSTAPGGIRWTTLGGKAYWGGGEASVNVNNIDSTLFSDDTAVAVSSTIGTARQALAGANSGSL